MKMRVIDMGRLAYREAWDRQVEMAAEVASGGPDTLVFVEHPPVMTLGASFHEENLLVPAAEYARQGIEVIKTDRGGDVTYHGPGQLVAYPIFDLRRHGKDLHKWMRDLEETVIEVCREFGIIAGREPSVNTGVWVGGRKVAAIGVKVRKWVSIHGIAINCDNDLRAFDLIVPCGIRTHGVTSLTKEAARQVTTEAARPVVARAFTRVFGLSLENADLGKLASKHDA